MRKITLLIVPISALKFFLSPNLPASLSVREEKPSPIAGQGSLLSLFEGKIMQNIHPMNHTRQRRVINRPLSNAEAFALFIMGVGFISSLALVMVYTLWGSSVA